MLYKAPTEGFSDGLGKGRTAILGLPEVAPFGGGFPLMANGQLVGAIGCSGGNTPTQDSEVCGAAAATLEQVTAILLRRIGIVGAGAWGTALAQMLCRAGRDVAIWAREPEVADAINRDRENPLFLPGIALDPAITGVARSRCGRARRRGVLLAVPAQYLRATCRALAALTAPLVICAKGIETGTGALMSEIVAATMPKAPLALLSGPTFAAEVARGLPTAVTLATGCGAGREPRRSARLARLPALSQR